jgi:hypothetical protein
MDKIVFVGLRWEVDLPISSLILKKNHKNEVNKLSLRAVKGDKILFLSEFSNKLARNINFV